MAKTLQESHDELAANLATRIAERAKLNPDAEAYVVRLGGATGMCVTFDSRDAFGTYSSPRSCGPHLATVMTLDEATRVAGTVKNGLGNRGEAVKLTEAYDDLIVMTRESLALIASML